MREFDCRCGRVVWVVLLIMSAFQAVVHAQQLAPVIPGNKTHSLAALVTAVAENTEAVIVVKDWKPIQQEQPKPIGYSNGRPLFAPDAGRNRKASLDDQAHRCNVVLFEGTPEIATYCRSHACKFSVFGFSFRADDPAKPQSLNYDGVQMIEFVADFPEPIVRFFGNSTKHHRNVPVIRSKLFAPFKRPEGPAPNGFSADNEKAQGPDIFIGLTQRILVAATSEQRLQSALDKLIDSKEGTLPEIVPSPYPESDSDVWAIRRDLTPIDDAQRDRRLIFAYYRNPQALTVRYQSNSPHAQKDLEKLIESSGLHANVRRIGSNSVQAELPVGDAGIWVLVFAWFGTNGFI